MKKYDPHTAPVPEDWNLLDEAERIELIKRYHKKAKIKQPNASLHAVGAALAHHIHAIMTNPETAPMEDEYYRELEALAAQKWRES